MQNHDPVVDDAFDLLGSYFAVPDVGAAQPTAAAGVPPGAQPLPDPTAQFLEQIVNGTGGPDHSQAPPPPDLLGSGDLGAADAWLTEEVLSSAVTPVVTSAGNGMVAHPRAEAVV